MEKKNQSDTRYQYERCREKYFRSKRAHSLLENQAGKKQHHDKAKQAQTYASGTCSKKCFDHACREFPSFDGVASALCRARTNKACHSGREHHEIACTACNTRRFSVFSAVRVAPEVPWGIRAVSQVQFLCTRSGYSICDQHGQRGRAMFGGAMLFGARTNRSATSPTDTWLASGGRGRYGGPRVRCNHSILHHHLRVTVE